MLSHFALRSLLLVLAICGLGQTADSETCKSGVCADGLVEMASQRAALCKTPKCQGGVIVGFANMVCPSYLALPVLSNSDFNTFSCMCIRSHCVAMSYSLDWRLK